MRGVLQGEFSREPVREAPRCAAPHSVVTSDRGTFPLRFEGK